MTEILPRKVSGTGIDGKEIAMKRLFCTTILVLAALAGTSLGSIAAEEKIILTPKPERGHGQNCRIGDSI